MSEREGERNWSSSLWTDSIATRETSCRHPAISLCRHTPGEEEHLLLSQEVDFGPQTAVQGKGRRMAYGEATHVCPMTYELHMAVA